MSILDMTAEQLLRVKRFEIADLPMGPNQRIAIFKKPLPNHQYVAGFDGAFGLDTGDFDCLTIADRNTTPWEEVACLHGRWGPTKTPKLLYAALTMYGAAFLVAERQGGGIAVMRELVDSFAYTYMWYSRDEKKVHKPTGDLFGYSTQMNDIALTNLRRVVRDNPKNPTFLIRDLVSLDEMRAMQWQARGERAQQEMLAGRRVIPDAQLKAGASAKHHDDTVISKALTLVGLMTVGEYESDKPSYPPGTFGYVDNPDELLAKQDREIRTGRVGQKADRGVFNRFLHE